MEAHLDISVQIHKRVFHKEFKATIRFLLRIPYISVADLDPEIRCFFLPLDPNSGSGMKILFHISESYSNTFKG
jgi:hypothetical protein